MPENQNDTIIHKNSSVLITGGSGLVGRYLTSALLSEGYKVSHLSRKTNQFGKIRVFRWDPEKGILDLAVLDGIDYIIHLSGANIGEKRWTKRRNIK
jgi:NAD dependent epimerase/dehydratase family enzyme